MGVNVQTVVGYREVTLALPDGRALHARAPDLRINVAVSAGALHVIDELCLNRLDLDEATRALETLERVAPRHQRWVVVLLFGLAAAAIAWLLRADWGAIVVSGVSAASGTGRAPGTRQAIGPPLHAALRRRAGWRAISGMAIRLGWTETPGFA